jgi:hypothetical protein
VYLITPTASNPSIRIMNLTRVIIKSLPTKNHDSNLDSVQARHGPVGTMEEKSLWQAYYNRIYRVTQSIHVQQLRKLATIADRATTFGMYAAGGAGNVKTANEPTAIHKPWKGSARTPFVLRCVSLGRARPTEFDKRCRAGINGMTFSARTTGGPGAVGLRVGDDVT